MINRKLCGYDVNGWRDGVARNWVARPGDEEEIGVVRIVEGAVLPEVVQAGEGKAERWIGGPQADLAPHGRGEGWGKVGKSERRRSVRSLLLDAGTKPHVLASAFTGLAQGASHSVVALDDSPSTTEQQQERLFAAMTAARAGKTLLVWRSVLSTIHALRSRALGTTARNNARIGVIGHVAEGFSLQTLRLRNDGRGGTDHLVPERRQVGALVPSPLGYQGLVALARAQVMALAPDNRSDHFGSARAIGRLAFGLEAKREPLRKANGDWDILDPPATLDLPSSHLTADNLDALRACDLVLFESLTEGAVRQTLLHLLRAAVKGTIVLLPQTAVAKGALISAERFSAGQTVYFDFLPKIATIVQGREGATSYDLIDDAETLPAGSLYRSPKPARLALQAGQEMFNVFLKKETHEQPRKARVEVGTPARDSVPIDLWVEQVPAAGRAKILLQAPSLARQFTVDWDTADVLDESWEKVLADLATPPPTIPARLVLPCGMFAWEDSPKGAGLLSLLERNVELRTPDWNALATKLTARPFGKYCISSDGDIPAEVPDRSRVQLDELTDRATQDLQAMMSGRRPADTAQLRFLTWQFRRAPAVVSVMLLDAWAARAENEPHFLANSPQAWVLIRQGLGRVVAVPEHEKKALNLLLRYPMQKWKWREETAAAAFLLSRSDNGPNLLERSDVELLCERVVKEFSDNLGTEYTLFQYAPFLLVGLLRWRLKTPRGLVIGSDLLADPLATSVERAITDLTRRQAHSTKLQNMATRWLRILSDTIDELRGSGGNPDLLAAIYDS